MLFLNQKCLVHHSPITFVREGADMSSLARYNLDPSCIPGRSMNR